MGYFVISSGLFIALGYWWYKVPKYRIVKFNTGRWALQNRVTRRYKDLYLKSQWWPKGDTFFQNCLASTKEKLIKEAGEVYIVYEEPVKKWWGKQ